MAEKEKIEIAKSNGTFFYTGTVTFDPDEGVYRIHTERGEHLKFRPDQIDSRRVIADDTKRGDNFAKRKQNL